MILHCPRELNLKRTLHMQDLGLLVCYQVYSIIWKPKPDAHTSIILCTAAHKIIYIAQDMLWTANHKQFTITECVVVPGQVDLTQIYQLVSFLPPRDYFSVVFKLSRLSTDHYIWAHYEIVSLLVSSWTNWALMSHSFWAFSSSWAIGAGVFTSQSLQHRCTNVIYTSNFCLYLSGDAVSLDDA